MGLRWAATVAPRTRGAPSAKPETIRTAAATTLTDLSIELLLVMADFAPGFEGRDLPRPVGRETTGADARLRASLARAGADGGRPKSIDQLFNFAAEITSALARCVAYCVVDRDGRRIRRRRHSAELLRAHPGCIYCGGANAATTIDHMPPRTVFNHRHRPKGLEFPACADCNSRSRPSDQVAGLISRIYPNTNTAELNAELKKMLHEVGNNHPGLLKETVPSERQVMRDVGNLLPGTFPLNASGPLLGTAMSTFAGKLGLAPHFHTTQRVLPAQGILLARWYTNHQVFTGAIPADLLQLVGEPSTLSQGKWNVGDQFLYASASTQDGQRSAHLAQFRNSFAVLAIAFADAPLSPEVHNFAIFRPGFLRPT